MQIAFIISFSLIALATLGNARTKFNFRCTDGSALDERKKICDRYRPWTSLEMKPKFDCVDMSDNAFCEDSFGASYTGCFSYEGNNTLRIIPCNHCVCDLEEDMDCLRGIPGDPKCKVCLTSSSPVEEGKGCGYPFEKSGDFRVILRDKTLPTLAKKDMMIYSGVWKCRDLRGHIAHCGDNGSEYFLHSYLSSKSYHCYDDYYWRKLLRKLTRLEICVRNG